MKLLLLGSRGSIGKRYAAVLRALDVEFDCYDNPKHEPGAKNFVGYSHFLIATPTHTHLALLTELTAYDHAYILCEKPISKLVKEIKKLKSLTQYVGQNVFVVNNYQFLPCANVARKIYYDFYNTGTDGLIWDVCQLVYLAWKNQQELEVLRDSYHWTLKWGQHRVPYNEIELSYHSMVKAFLSGEVSKLWDLSAALKMSELCAELYEKGGNCEYFSWRPTNNAFIAFAANELKKDGKVSVH